MFHKHLISIFEQHPISKLSPPYLNPVAYNPIMLFVFYVDLVPVDWDLTDCPTKPLPNATQANSLLLGKDFPAELVGPVWVLFWFGIL